MRKISYRLLKPQQREALNEASKAMEGAYNPYSHFYVGAALYTEDGSIVSGSNFENAAYGSTICAERSAVLRANAMGLRSFKGIALIARGKDFDTKVITAPCGACRQVLYEISAFSKKDLEVVMSTSKKDKIVIATIKELLPLAFGPLDIGIDLSQFR